jgi:hypothetical protein
MKNVGLKKIAYKCRTNRKNFIRFSPNRAIIGPNETITIRCKSLSEGESVFLKNILLLAAIKMGFDDISHIRVMVLYANLEEEETKYSFDEINDKVKKFKYHFKNY